MRATHLIASSFILVAGTGTAAWSQAYNQQVNPQVTDSVTQPNVEVVGEAPAMSQGNLYQEESQALSNAAHSATTAQQQTNVTAQAATTMGVPTLDSVDTASTEAATRDIFGATAAEPY